MEHFISRKSTALDTTSSLLLCCMHIGKITLLQCGGDIPPDQIRNARQLSASSDMNAASSITSCRCPSRLNSLSHPPMKTTTKPEKTSVKRIRHYWSSSHRISKTTSLHTTKTEDKSTARSPIRYHPECRHSQTRAP